MTRAGMVAVSLLCALTLSAQAPLQFEVASIKANTSDGPPNYWQISGRRFIGTRSQIIQLVRMAWGDMQIRVDGAPGWTIEDRYDVIANAPVDFVPGAPALRDMMRALLVDRFKLAARLETRQESIYALVPVRANGALGPRLQPPLPECPPVTGASVAPGACGPGVGRGAIKYGNLTMAGLALALAWQVGRRVIDDTGLAGGYKVDMEFTTRALDAAPPQPGEPLPPVPDGLTLFQALEQHLGLKLEPRRGTVEVIVIDHIERPSAN